MHFNLLKVLFTLSLTTIVVSHAFAANDRQAVKGLWSNGSSIFKVYEENGQLFGQIISLKDPLYTREEDPVDAGKAKMDKLNPDETLQNQPIIGLQMFSEYSFEDRQWQGKIYDPESGNTYQSKMKLNKDGFLEIRGYVGIPMFGRTAIFEPVSSCKPEMVEMLSATRESGVCQATDEPPGMHGDS